MEKVVKITDSRGGIYSLNESSIYPSSVYIKNARPPAKGIVRIDEHQAMGEGDKWYYDIVMIDGSYIRIFDVIEAIILNVEE